MSIPFSRSVLALRADSSRRGVLGVATTAAVLGVWGACFVFARVNLYEVSNRARVEVREAAHPVQTPLDGEVIAVQFALGQQVQQGDVLVELDARVLRRELAQTEVRRAGVEAQIAAVRAQIEAQERNLREQQGVAQARLGEAIARRREAESGALYAEGEASRAVRLSREGLLSASDAARADSEGKMRRGVLEASRFSLLRTEAERRAKETELGVELLKQRRDLVQLEAQAAEVRAVIEKLSDQIDDHRIVAPISGQVGEISGFQVGSFLHRGDKITSLVPGGVLRIVAEYAPAHAAGRVAPGQPGRLRLDGFPWTQYGSVPVVVKSVGSELRDGLVRVELGVQPGHDTAVLLQHGLPGKVEVEVERISLAALVLRTVGEKLQGSSAASGP
ncbi:HlyD family secretion protein [Sorangium sp. So ce1153]|uniref:HlyD family secretion protein n=1 Tax=Sorangium sp. So ce1153 TaxID=3133333 RepID=UPI003F634161